MLTRLFARSRRSWLSCLAMALAAAATGCSAPELGELPALCSDGACPEGYACIHGVCARPGTPIPITVADLSQLRGVDLKVVPQATTALVAWQTYAYSQEGEQLVGARVSPDGAVSRAMPLVSSFIADPESVEPFYDLLSVPGGDLLAAISAAPLLGEPNPSPRLITYRVTLPPEGQEASGVQFGAAWKEEMRLGTVGYGAVSKPKLLLRDGAVELGYFQSRTEVGKTIGELVVIGLQKDGSLVNEGAPPATFTARDGLPVAVGVEGAFVGTTGAFWVLDDERPSVLLLTNDGAALERGLARLSIPGEVVGSSLLSIEPSARTGEKLPTSAVDGPASLNRTDHVLSGDPPEGELVGAKVGAMMWMRDTPRPAWVSRQGKPPLVVSPGKDLGASTIKVYAVDTGTGATSIVAEIERFATSDVDAVAATLVGGKLFVAWAETAERTKIRAAVIPEP